jgi:hypothetical protein
MVESSKVVDCTEGGCVIGTQCLLTACQCSLVHLLGLLQLALIGVEIPKVVDCTEGGFVITT